MTGKYEIANSLTVLSFGLPVLYFLLKRKALTPFSLNQVTTCFNLALLVQLVLSGLYLSLMWFIGKKIYAEGTGTTLTDILMHMATTFNLVGAFFYLPGLFILNIVSFIISNLRAKE